MAAGRASVPKVKHTGSATDGGTIHPTHITIERWSLLPPTDHDDRDDDDAEQRERNTRKVPW
jgi:hypothetical protein